MKIIKNKSYRRSRLRGFGEIVARLEEVVGKDLRDYCFDNKVSISESVGDAVADWLVKVGKVASREALQKKIEDHWESD